jgi:RNA polymerase sigma-70 factor (ECF subfamily)
VTVLTDPTPSAVPASSAGVSLFGAAGSAALAETVSRARRGEVDAFERLYRACVGRVHATCLRLHGGRREDAEDSVQEAFVRAWKRLPQFRGDSGFPTWLHRIAVNAALDRIRVDNRRPGVAGADEDAVERRVPAPRRSPDAVLDLERAIAALPERARLAFVLHDVEGYKHREIAELTGTAEGTWKSQLHRARRLLREALER